ncbi:MAG TPA: uroporphyrinogen decarboxylase [Candidatus Limnocylindrales bacterium]|jgi:uroporphyrinogen decarboxylase|nr:uroporphyrinogen decarboxylase [Candidatus Limnocylindrales bacterium]
MNDRFLRACRREPVDATPVWFMRQAGRSFAAYRKLRERYGILELAKSPDLCAEVTLMPVRELGVDAAVLFADIMLPLEPMGVGLRIEPEVGPIIDRPIRSAADVAALRPFDPGEVSFTLEAIRLVRRELDGKAGVIGFSGAPFTLACYLIEGRPSRDYAVAKAFMYREPEAWHDLMERLSAMVAVYLRAQIDAGGEVVQLFDSWVGGLGPADYAAFVQPHVRRIFAALDGVPTIHFGTGTAALLELMAEAGGDMIGIDHRVSLADAWRRIGPDRGIQGNLDAARVLAGWEATEAGARAVLAEAAGRPGHVFNLGHGVLPETDTGILRRLVDFVHEQTARSGAATEALS